jgi:hypothetical protein
MLSIAEVALESEGPMQIHNSKNILIISVSYNFLPHADGDKSAGRGGPALLLGAHAKGPQKNSPSKARQSILIFDFLGSGGKFRRPGSARGASGNRRLYLNLKKNQRFNMKSILNIKSYSVTLFHAH